MGRKTAIIVGAILGAAYFVFGMMFAIGIADMSSWTKDQRVVAFIVTPLAVVLGVLIMQIIYDD